MPKFRGSLLESVIHAGILRGTDNSRLRSHKHVSSKLPRKDVVRVQSFVEFLASIRLASSLNRRTYGNSTERAGARSYGPACFEIALNRTAIIQRMRFPNLEPRAFLERRARLINR